jgi:hypothetical protein
VFIMGWLLVSMEDVPLSPMLMYCPLWVAIGPLLLMGVNVPGGGAPPYCWEGPVDEEMYGVPMDLEEEDASMVSALGAEKGCWCGGSPGGGPAPW